MNCSKYINATISIAEYNKLTDRHDCRNNSESARFRLVTLFLYTALMLLILLFARSASAKGTDFDVKRMPLSDAISLLWGEVLHTPFMLAPELSTDARLVTLHIAPGNDERDFIIRYLDNMHIRVTRKKGVDYIAPYIPKVPQPRIESYVYTPRYRSVAYIAGVLSGSSDGVGGMSIGTTGGGFSTGGGAPLQGGNGQAASSPTMPAADGHFMSQSGDTFLYRGTALEIAQIRALMPSIDTRPEQVDVTAYVYEVNTDERNGSGLALAAKLLNGHFSISTGTRQGYGNFIRFSSGSLDALYELFRTDNRFSLVTGAHSQVVSGSSAMLAGGASVPTLGSVSYENGTPVQSVEYRNTGVTLQVSPVVTQDLISMNINEQLSDYSETTTGVNNSPTFTNRQITTTVNMKDGDIIVLSGLTQDKNGKQSTGLSFLPKSWSTKSDQKTGMDLLIVLQARKIKG
ncbi:type II secretion system protein GspD [Salmonella enterica]|nr:type II secretion system protein GspD [Salmonella enterica]EEU4804690.1 type II secretion system protein GspD [Salmonella enterica]EEU4868192.1 type II secretion system protein GspD [Salmonella enterica]EEU4895585.1 type II secretion system protein GspD [Salmonella enterica]